MTKPTHSQRPAPQKAAPRDVAHPNPPPPTDSPGVRVLCVDDHAVLIEGLNAQFSIGGRIGIVGRLPSAETLLADVARFHPDIVIMDIEMPGPDAFEMTDRLRHMHPNVKVIILSAHIKEAYLAAAFKSGACGYFAKSDDLEDITKGVMEVAHNRGNTFVLGRKVKDRCSPSVTEQNKAANSSLTSPASGPTPTTRIDALSVREIEVLRFIGKGLSRVQIAAQLSRSAKTIDGHQERIMRKLGIDSRADLMRFAIREGLAEV